MTCVVQDWTKHVKYYEKCQLIAKQTSHQTSESRALTLCSVATKATRAERGLRRGAW